ncbi:unnamed protein product [Adineta steineri]|uniref:DUF4378 domain-containing protein n=1 Tax=Adineta steineri TaxID=433720 RepID=A0A814HAJ0_9BILA|nr:unnamed protein product [Adineta steineri]
MRSRSEPPAQNGTTSKNAQRHENLLRWAVDLTRDCDVVENRFKYLRPDRILPFGTIPASYKHLQQDDGNIRNQTSHYDTNHSETNKSSNVSRLSRGLNSNRLNDYSNHQVSNDLSSDRRIHRDRAAAKIQAAYRGYTVRKSLPWLNDKPNHLDNEYNNKRSNHYLENASININIHLTKNNYPVDSTLLRYYENSCLYIKGKILTAREKRVRQKFNSDIELQADEKRLKDIEKKIRQLVKREPDQSNLPNEIFPSSPRLQKIETDDTSHDISEVDDGNQYIEQQKKADILTETLIKVFIEEAIQQGKEIVYRKSQNSFTKEVSEWLSDEDLTDEENNNKQIPNNHDEDVDNVIQTLAIQQEFLEQLDAAANGNHENDELNLDLSHLEDKNHDTSHDISEVDDGNQYIEQQKKADILTETLIKVFIEEAIQQGKEIVYRKSQNSFTKEVSEWLSDEDLTDEENNNKQIPNNHDEDVDNVIQTLAIQQEFLEQLDAAANGNHENDELNLDLSHLEDKNPDGSQIDNSARLAIDIPVKPVVPHTCEQVSQLCHEALTILYNYNTDFSDRSSIDRAIPASYFAIDFSSNQNEETENDDIQRSRHAYNQMIFDLCVELLHEMYSPNIRLTKYPEWQKTKLISKRFYRSNKPKTRDEAENFIEKKIFEILNLIPRQIVYSKWRMLIDRRHGHEQFEMVLDEELRRTENSWIDYDDDCIRIKFDISEHIFEQLIQETLVDCIDVINKKLSLSSNSTRL